MPIIKLDDDDVVLLPNIISWKEDIQKISSHSFGTFLNFF